MTLGQITERSNRPRNETILQTCVKVSIQSSNFGVNDNVIMSVSPAQRQRHQHEQIRLREYAYRTWKMLGDVYPRKIKPIRLYHPKLWKKMCIVLILRPAKLRLGTAQLNAVSQRNSVHTARVIYESRLPVTIQSLGHTRKETRSKFW